MTLRLPACIRWTVLVTGGLGLGAVATPRRHASAASPETGSSASASTSGSDGATLAASAEKAVASAAPPPAPTASTSAKASGPKTDEEASTERGDYRWGLTGTLLRLRATRDWPSSALGRTHHLDLEVVPGEFGFQFTYRPHTAWFELHKKDGRPFQLMSIGGMLLTQLNREHTARTSLTIAFTMSFLEDTLVLGVGIDLYRGIPLTGEQTAPTGVLGWAWSRRGEFTTENFSLLVGINLAAFASRISGTGS